MTTLQAVTWAGAARRIPHRRNSAGGRCTISYKKSLATFGTPPPQLDYSHFSRPLFATIFHLTTKDGVSADF